MPIMDGETSYIILRKQVNPELVQRARKALSETLEEKRRSVEKETIFVNIFESYEDWPEACKLLLVEIKRALPFEKYVPSTSYRVDTTIGIYQPNKLTGRGPANAYFYTIGIDETVGTHNGMPEYIQGSHNVYDKKVLNSLPRPKDPLCLKEGDVLVWKGETAFECSGTGNSSFMLIKLSYG